MSTFNFNGSDDLSWYMFKDSSEEFQHILNTMGIPAEHDLHQSSKDDEQMVEGLNPASPVMWDTSFGVDDGGAASFCNFLEQNTEIISDGAGRCWGNMSMRQRARFAPNSVVSQARQSKDLLYQSSSIKPVATEEQQRMEAKTPVTPVAPVAAAMSEAIFGSKSNSGSVSGSISVSGFDADEAFSNFLKDFQLRYGEVFTDKEIRAAAKRRWKKVRGQYEPESQSMQQKACLGQPVLGQPRLASPKPRRMACPKLKRKAQRCPKPRSAQKKCAKPRAVRKCPKPRSVKRCPKPRPACNDFGTKLKMPMPKLKNQAPELQSSSIPLVSTFDLTDLGDSSKK